MTTTSNPAYRPQYNQRVRLLRVARDPGEPNYEMPSPQAVVGDVVTAIRTLTPPTGFHAVDAGCLWINHWGGANCMEHMEKYGKLCGTAGEWGVGGDMIDDDTEKQIQWSNAATEHVAFQRCSELAFERAASEFRKGNDQIAEAIRRLARDIDLLRDDAAKRLQVFSDVAAAKRAEKR
jgi:hypothetical protein